MNTMLLIKNPIIGRSYYRLKQTDFDGTTTYSDLISIEYEGPAFAALRADPNPSIREYVNTSAKRVNEVMDVPVRIVSMRGELVFEGIVDETGKSTKESCSKNRLLQFFTLSNRDLAYSSPKRWQLFASRIRRD